MRYAGGILIADDPAVWTWAVDAIEAHVMAAEPSLVGRKLKGGVFRLLRMPAFRHCLPKRSVSDIHILKRGAADKMGMAFRRSHGKWISFNVQDATLTRYFPSRWRWQKEHWIRTQPSVTATSPPMLHWDNENLTARERYIAGRPALVHDIDEGRRAFTEMWPLLTDVFRTRTTMRNLRLPGWVRKPEVMRWFRQNQLDSIIEETLNTAVLHGLIHGDLQQSNILVTEERFYIIDWGDHFHLRPPLYDLLFYFFKHSRSLPASEVAAAVFDRPEWIEDALPGALDPPAVRASLLAFMLMLTNRYQFRAQRRRQRLVKDVQRFVAEVARRLLPENRDADALVRLPAILLERSDIS